MTSGLGMTYNQLTDAARTPSFTKDEARFPHLHGQWAYFDFGREMKTQVEALPATARCYACHAENAAVDNTFVQFYPTLLDVAKKHGTLNPSPK